MRTMRIGDAARRAAMVLAASAALALAACGGGGGGFGDTPAGTPASPLVGSYTGPGSMAVVDGSGYMIGSASFSNASTSQNVSFSGNVVDQGGGTWSIPFALISTTITPTGAPSAQYTTRGAVTGTWATRDALTIKLPPLAVPPEMSASHTVVFTRAQPVTAAQIIGHYVEQGGTPVHPVPIREFDVFTPARFVGTYVAGCLFDGTIYSLDPASAVLTADAVFIGPSCPDATGYNRRLVGTFTLASAESPAQLRMSFADNSGNLHTVFGLRTGGQ